MSHRQSCVHKLNSSNVCFLWCDLWWNGERSQVLECKKRLFILSINCVAFYSERRVALNSREDIFCYRLSCVQNGVLRRLDLFWWVESFGPLGGMVKKKVGLWRFQNAYQLLALLVLFQALNKREDIS